MWQWVIVVMVVGAILVGLLVLLLVLWSLLEMAARGEEEIAMMIRGLKPVPPGEPAEHE